MYLTLDNYLFSHYSIQTCAALGGRRRGSPPSSTAHFGPSMDNHGPSSVNTVFWVSVVDLRIDIIAHKL